MNQSLGGKVDPGMGSVAEGLLGRGAAAAKVVGLLTILDDLSLVVGDRDFPGHFKGTVLHAFHVDFRHLSLLRVKSLMSGKGESPLSR